jgi:hypothetical protein
MLCNEHGSPDRPLLTVLDDRFGVARRSLKGRVQPPTNHTIYFCACDCTCERQGNAGLREAMRPSLLSVDFPRLSHGINVLTQILLPCVAWRCVEVERAMGIEPTAQAWEAWVLPLYDARAVARF